MLNRMTALLRLLFVALVLGLAVGATAARSAADQPQATARTTARTKAEPVAPGQDEFPLGGLLIIAGIVGVVVLLAWISSRIGDSRRSDVVC
jgi:hypothetical protein